MSKSLNQSEHQRTRGSQSPSQSWWWGKEKSRDYVRAKQTRRWRGLITWLMAPSVANQALSDVEPFRSPHYIILDAGLVGNSNAWFEAEIDYNLQYLVEFSIDIDLLHIASWWRIFLWSAIIIIIILLLLCMWYIFSKGLFSSYTVLRQLQCVVIIPLNPISHPASSSVAQVTRSVIHVIQVIHVTQWPYGIRGFRDAALSYTTPSLGA